MYCCNELVYMIRLHPEQYIYIIAYLCYNIYKSTQNRREVIVVSVEKDRAMAEDIAALVKEYGGHTYYVGGYVRDRLLGKQSKDIDIEVHGITPDVLKFILESKGELRTQGASFGVYNLAHHDIDIAQPRKEHTTGRGHKDFDVYVDPFIGCEGAAKRRDFTINAMMQDVLTGEIIDPYNGQEDLKNGIIRHVNDESFGEDPLRVLRGAQFAARFSFSIALETKELMSSMDLTALSKERIYGEMQKALLKSEKPSVFFDILRDINQLEPWFHEVNELIGCKQNAQFHPEGDVYNHTMQVLDAAAEMRNNAVKPEKFMVSALCHDFGKPVTTTVDEDGIVHSYGHDSAGKDICEQFLKRVNNDVLLTKYVTNMCDLHMRLVPLYENDSKIKKTNAVYDESVCPHDLILLSMSDVAGKGFRKERDVSFKDWCENRLVIYEERMKQPQVGGKDLMNLGLKPSPMFNDLINKAHQLHLSGVDKDDVLKDFRTRLTKRGVLPKSDRATRVAMAEDKFGDIEAGSDSDYEKG